MLVGALMIGVFWLVQPGSSGTREAKAAPIPPRIADSIERKKAIVPVVEPVQIRVPLQEANVSLSQSAPTFKIGELAPPPANKPKRNKPPREERTITTSTEPAPRPTVSTARTDSPY